MALAELLLQEESDTELLFYVRTEPWRAKPWPSNARGTARDFKVHGAGSATYEWKTGIDELRELARAVISRRSRSALRSMSKRCRHFLDNHVEQYLEYSAQDPEAFPERTEQQIVRETLMRIASGGAELEEADGPDAVYLYDDDKFLADARDALPFPPWARPASVGEGGPGSGYDQAAVIIDKPQTLEELARFVKAARSVRPRSGRRPTPRRV